MLFKKIDIFLIFSLLILLILILPFVGILPHRDGNINFVEANDFYKYGFDGYLKNWQSVHPPFKLALTSVFFFIFGENTMSYTVIGILSGIVGIIAIYSLCKNIFSIKIARISSILLATSPLFLATSIFSLTDFIITNLLLFSLYLYTKRLYISYSLIASCVVLTKETGIILPITVFIIEFIYLIKKILQREEFSKEKNMLIANILPITVILLWILFLNSYGKQPWTGAIGIFSDTASRGAIYTVINSLLTLNIFNKYTQQHWLQLFVLNFNWLYWLIGVLSFIIYICAKGNYKKTVNKIIQGDYKTKTMLVIGVFSITYLFTVLTFPTYTIPRYALPIIPFLIILVSLWTNYLVNISKFFKIITLISLSTIIYLALFHSVDPISKNIWGEKVMFGEKIYALDQTLDGNDGITYNIQYLLIAKKRSEEIMRNLNAKLPLPLDKCQNLFPDPNNDRKTMFILKLNNATLCLYGEGVNW